MLTLNRRGDTIVEVLIAIAIVSLVLTAAYVISNKNTVAIQANQERIQAQHLVEAQIEALRAQGKLNTSGDCFNAAGVEVGGAACKGLTQAGSGAAYSALLVAPGSGLPAGTPCSAVSTASYLVCVYWSSLNGGTANDSNVSMYYRL